MKLWGSDSFVLIGASALGCFIDMRWRQTKDLDLSVSISMDDYPAGLDRLQGWSRHPSREHEWTSPDGVRVDIVPCSERMLEAGEVIWPESGFRMSLVGFRLAFEHAQQIRVDDLIVRVAPIPVVAVLKVIAYLDHPQLRDSDLEDLSHLLEGYLAEDEERRFSQEVIDHDLSSEQTSAFLLGMDISAIVDSLERQSVSSFLERVVDEGSPEATQAHMMRLGPAPWREDPDLLLAAIQAFELGFGKSTAQGTRSE
jgi:predicted nucleotidyltransferase